MSLIKMATPSVWLVFHLSPANLYRLFPFSQQDFCVLLMHCIFMYLRVSILHQWYMHLVFVNQHVCAALICHRNHSTFVNILNMVFQRVVFHCIVSLCSSVYSSYSSAGWGGTRETMRVGLHEGSGAGWGSRESTVHGGTPQGQQCRVQTNFTRASGHTTNSCAEKLTCQW